jgi:hypothetical protein
MKTISSFALLLCASTVLIAQTPTASPKKTTRPRTRVQRVQKPRLSPTRDSSPKLSEDFFVGEAKVDVTKDETVVRLAMAQHGSVLIELPANDGPRYIIPGDPEMATVDEKALERNKRAIVVRPGTQFVVPQHNTKARNPAATVTAQMRSGLVVTFLFYPVDDLAQNVHRCVLNYNRDEVVARRRAAGLPVNLDDKEQQGGEKPTAQSTVTPTPIKTDDQAASERKDSASVTETKEKEDKENRSSSRTVVSSTVKSAPDNSEVVASLRAALDHATKKPKQFKNWTRSTHGLKLSILESPDTGKSFRVLIVAVKNTSTASVTLASDPELSIETVDDQGTTVNINSIAKTQIDKSNATGVITAGATAYFAIAFASPVLDAHQQLKIDVAQTNAADEPASIKLAIRGR